MNCHNWFLQRNILIHQFLQLLYGLFSVIIQCRRGICSVFSFWNIIDGIAFRQGFDNGLIDSPPSHSSTRREVPCGFSVSSSFSVSTWRKSFLLSLFWNIHQTKSRFNVTKINLQAAKLSNHCKVEATPALAKAF